MPINLEDTKIGTHKIWTSPKDGLRFMAIAEGFGEATTVLVSRDSVAWIAHDAKEILEKIKNDQPIRVA